MLSQVLDYGVPENNIMGIRYGFKGFYDRKHKPLVLTRRCAAGASGMGLGRAGVIVPRSVCGTRTHAPGCRPAPRAPTVLRMAPPAVPPTLPPTHPYSMVEEIHLEGGTILGTSRGLPNVPEIVKRLDLWKVDILFVVGGRGGQAAAESIHRECRAKAVPCCVVAVPKSIDNDLLLLDKSFGWVGCWLLWYHCVASVVGV